MKYTSSELRPLRLRASRRRMRSRWRMHCLDHSAVAGYGPNAICALGGGCAFRFTTPDSTCRRPTGGDSECRSQGCSSRHRQPAVKLNRAIIANPAVDSPPGGHHVQVDDANLVDASTCGRMTRLSVFVRAVRLVACRAAARAGKHAARSVRHVAADTAWRHRRQRARVGEGGAGEGTHRPDTSSKRRRGFLGWQ